MAERKALNQQDLVPDSSSEAWNALPWKKFERHVFRIQKRIYRASQRGNHRAVQKLQKLLLKSEAARLLAARQVARTGQKEQRRKGNKALSARARFILARQIHPRSWPHGKSRPTRHTVRSRSGLRVSRLSFLHNQACQLLLACALEPAWQMPCTARSRDQPRHAAIVALWRAIRYQDSYVWQADLSSCLEHLDQQTLLKKLNASSIVRQALKNWLRAGLVSLETPSGTDGASLSALLVQIALHDLDTVLRQAFTGDRSTPALVRYAGEIVVLHPTEAGLAKAQAALESWLQDNGLDSLADSAICTHTLQTYQGNVGLHFAGWDVRQYPTARTQRVGARRTPAFETVIRPARSQVRLHMDELRRVIVRHQAASQETLLADLNPLISAWSARYGTVFGGETLRACDRLLWKLLWNWTRKRHPNKGAQWRYARYWLPTAKGSQVFMTTRGLALLRHSSARSRASTSVPRPASFVEDSVPCLDRAKERGITLLPRQNMTRSNLLNSRSIRLERRSK